MPLDPKSVTPDRNEVLPLWRRHFPIDTEADTNRSRREFVGGAAVAGGAMACGQIALSQFSPSASESDAREETKHTYPSLVLEKKLHNIETDEAVLFHYPDDKSPCLLVKLGDEEFVAFAQKCTHLACPVIPDTECAEFHCPCHHGKFDLRTGKPTAGPPQRPLPAVQFVLGDDGTLTATGIIS